MPRTRVAHTIGELTLLARSITPETKSGDVFLESSHAKLQELLAEIEKLSRERDFHQAQKQEATRKINELLEKGRRQATLLRSTLKVNLGPKNEQLAAYGIQPFRGRKRSKKADGAPPASPETPDGEPSS